MEIICPPNQCTGCMACQAICPHNAIINVKNKLGFSFPKITQDVCTNCGLCVRICPSLHTPHLNPSDKVYALAAKDTKVLEKCASGGIATLLAKQFIIEGGVVYGCSGEDIEHICHIRIDNVDELYKIQGSKYVQSDIRVTYKQVKQDLLSGLKVLYIGISCQIAGIKNFLIRNFENLYTIDIICHGGASQKMISDDIEYYRRKYHLSAVSNIRFREKVIENSALRVKYGLFFSSGNKTFDNVGKDDPFTYGYSQNILFRDSCYNCKYTNLQRVGDLTIGDFWKLGKDAGLYDRLGVSLCLPHTIKGKEMIDKIFNEVDARERTLQEAIHGNPQLIKPTKPGNDMSIFRKISVILGTVRSLKLIRTYRLNKNRIKKLFSVVISH